MYKGDKFFRTVDENCYRVAPRLRDTDRTGVTVQARCMCCAGARTLLHGHCHRVAAARARAERGLRSGPAQVLSTIPVLFNYDAKPADTLDCARFLNDHIAQICREDPAHFIGLGTLPMQAPELAVPELRRCMQELGLAGVQIGSHINELPLSDPLFNPIWEEGTRCMPTHRCWHSALPRPPRRRAPAIVPVSCPAPLSGVTFASVHFPLAAERLGAAVFVHPWEMKGMAKEKYWLPWWASCARAAPRSLLTPGPAAQAGGDARRDLARHLLAHLRRRHGALPASALLLRARRRQLPGHHRPHPARLRRAARPRCRCAGATASCTCMD
jgi:hypothetical protein